MVNSSWSRDQQFMVDGGTCHLPTWCGRGWANSSYPGCGWANGLTVLGLGRFQQFMVKGGGGESTVLRASGGEVSQQLLVWGGVN